MQLPQKFYDIELWPYISKAVACVSESDPVEAAQGALASSPYRAVFVTKPQTLELRGVITVCDLAKLNRQPKPATAKDLATTEDVVAIRTDAKLWQALRMLSGENILKRPMDRIPVVDARNNLAGVITKDDLYRYFGDVNLSEMPWPRSQVAPSGSLSY